MNDDMLNVSWLPSYRVDKQARQQYSCFKMSIKIVRPNYTIEVEHEAELGVVLRALDNYQLAMPIPSPNPVVESPAAEGTPAALWACIKSDKGRAMMKALAESKAGVTETELRSVLNLATKYQLGGIVHGISNAAKSQNLPLSRVWKKDSSKVGGVRTVTYRLTNKMAEGIKEASSQEQSES